MNMKRFLVIFVVILALVVSISGCVRSKVKPIPIGTPSSGGTKVGTVDVMGQLELFVTQTAMAASGKPAPTGVPGGPKTPAAPAPTTAPGVPTSTTEPGAPTSTPEAPTEPVATQVPATEVPAGPTATLRPFPTSTPGIPKSYTLQTGEFIYCIARRFNVNPTELLSVNGLGSGSLVFAGMELKIPQTGNPFPGSRSLKPHPTYYTVASGDTLNTIACSFGSADPNTIAAANGLTPPYKLTSGQSLYIP